MNGWMEGGGCDWDVNKLIPRKQLLFQAHKLLLNKLLEKIFFKKDRPLPCCLCYEVSLQGWVDSALQNRQDPAVVFKCPFT